MNTGGYPPGTTQRVHDDEFEPDLCVYGLCPDGTCPDCRADKGDAKYHAMRDEEMDDPVDHYEENKIAEAE